MVFLCNYEKHRFFLILEMEATVNDFLKEINDLAPAKQNNAPAWQECFDKLTGYSYYWNTVTDEVTWDRPTDFTSVQEQKKKCSKITQLYVPPRAAPPLFPGVTKITQDKVKIYSIQQNLQDKAKNANRKKHGRSSDSNDEKIELITSYGGDTESEPEESEKKKHVSRNSPSSDKNHSDEDDELDLLAKIHSRVKELQELEKQPTNTSGPAQKPKDTTKHVPSFSLVAGYSDSEDENQENEEIKSIFPIATPVAETMQTSHSTLFPIAQPVDVKDFESKPPETVQKSTSPISDFDSKAFKRKRRIAVPIAVNNTIKKHKDTLEEESSERKGFGFGSEEDIKVNRSNLYTGFSKGGVLFVKSETLNPREKKENNVVVGSKDEELSKADLEDSYSTLKEKLLFLSEGREPVLPVQVMIIQAETLFLAMREDGLKPSYLQKWLDENCADLVRLEKEAAPEGWILQWDRTHKRYYYQNTTTGESQWVYPQPDITRCDDAMDISTTPPPVDLNLPISPPLPPTIRSPTPPPPPVITVDSPGTDVMLAPLPLEPQVLECEEPLPPGVDLPEIMTLDPSKDDMKVDTLNSALDSFYSEIAAVTDRSNSPPSHPPIAQDQEHQNALEVGKKKKKAKVKLGPGLSMKKKGVSELVEKWKNVQKSYND